MRILAPILILCLLSSCITWRGAGISTLSDDQRARGIQDVETMAGNYQTSKYWRDVRRRYNGRSNAVGRGFAQIQATFDRHFWNYSVDDPYVNYESSLTPGDHLLRFMGGFLAR